MDPHSGKVYYVENDDEARKRGLIPIPHPMRNIAAYAAGSGVSMFVIRDAQARKWAKRQKDKARNRRRSQIAKASRRAQR